VTEAPAEKVRVTRRAIALMGNPNTGKSSLFNALTGLRQKIANFPGVTVEAKLGNTRIEDQEFTVIDLPGTYSMAARSPDEMVATQALLGRIPGTPKPDGVVVVLDASSLDRNLYLATQVLEFGLPTVVALTMVDVAKSRGIQVDAEKLQELLGVPVVPVNSPRNQGIAELKETLARSLGDRPARLKIPFPRDFSEAVDQLYTQVESYDLKLGYRLTRPEALRLLVDAKGPVFDDCERVGGRDFVERFNKLRERAGGGRNISMVEAQSRYELIGEWTAQARQSEDDEKPRFSDKVDSLLTHKLWGTLIFIVVMGGLFNALFLVAEPLGHGLEHLMEDLGEFVAGLIPASMPMLASLVENGIFGGVGAVVEFLPPILILFLFIAILEDLGYMSRAAFLMDRLMARFGLSGRSFIPLLSSFACAIPGIMATRVIEDRNTRLTTIFLAPFMSCAARLPVYTLMIAAFVPKQSVLGFLSLQGLTLFAMYWVGVLFAIPTAFVLKKGILKSKVTPFLLELPSYKMPRPKAIGRILFDRGWVFLKRAGTIIFAVAVIVWTLSYFPRDQQVIAEAEQKREAAEQRYEGRVEDIARVAGMSPAELTASDRVAVVVGRIERLNTEHEAAVEALDEDADDYPERFRALREDHTEAIRELQDEHSDVFETASQLHTASREYESRSLEIAREEAGELLARSYLGRAGHFIEPAVEPLGWDWRIGMAAIASIPAREVVIASMGTIFNLGDVDEDDPAPLREVLQRAERPDGTRLFTLATGLSVMVFFALCAQCAATLAIMRRETNTWRWPVASFVYMTVLAYIAAFVTYQVATMLGA
jgi:ferrous iron transport protein B